MLKFAVFLLFVASFLNASVIYQNLTLREYWGVQREQDFVTGGIPLPKGLISNPAQIGLLSPGGAQVPMQTKPLMKWPDGSLRWLLVTFPADINGNSTADYRLVMQSEGSVPIPTYTPGTVSVTENSSHVTVSTGKMIMQIKKSDGFNLFDRVTIDADNDGNVNDEIISPSINNGAFIKDMYDSIYTGNNSPVIDVKVEESGPMRAVIKITGNHSDGKSDHRFYGFLCRIYFYAGKSDVRVQYSLKNSYFKPRGVLAFRSMMLKVKPNLTGSKTVTFYDDSLRTSALTDSAYVYQPWPFGFETKVNGTTLHSVDTADKKARTLGWMDISDNKWGVAVGIYNFASQTPKELFASSDGSLEARLWPARYPQGQDSANYARGAVYLGLNEVDKFYIGMGEHKTHEVAFHFHGGTPIAAKTADKMGAFNHKLLPNMDRKWVSLSRAVLSEMAPDSLAIADPSLASNKLPLINKVLGDPSYIGSADKKFYYDTWVNYGEAYWRNETGSTEYYENIATGYFRKPDPRTLRLLEGSVWICTDMRRVHLDSMLGNDLKMSIHFWLRDSIKVRDPRHSVFISDGPGNVGKTRIWIAPTPGNQTEHYTSYDMFNYYLLTGDLKVRDGIYDWAESNADYKSWKLGTTDVSYMSRGYNSGWSSLMFATFLENDDTVRGGRTVKKYFEDQLIPWTQGAGTKKGIIASLEPSGAWHSSLQGTAFGPHNFFEALIDFGFSWYSENFWNDSLTNYFTRRVTCYKDSVFGTKSNILYHGWGYNDTLAPSATSVSNFRVPGSLARLFYFTGDTVFERKMNQYGMDGKNSTLFKRWDHAYLGNLDMTVFQPYLFYLKNKSDYRKNPIIDWTYTDGVEDPLPNGTYVSAPSLTAAPNPFNPTVTIKFSAAAYGTDPNKAVKISVVSPDGRLIYNENTTVCRAAKGIVWNGKDLKGTAVSTGIYFVKVSYSGKSIVKKLTMVR